MDKQTKEGVVLVGLLPKKIKPGMDVDLEELENLVTGAGGKTLHKFVQRKDKPDPATLIGRGKALELSEIVRREGIHCVVFDQELSPTQQRNLEGILDCKILDRTQLILDVFARRARTREGILQVELAQHSYLLPRLSGRGKELMQQLGGIGARGPGERALEYDRRRIRAKIQHLKNELNRVVLERQVQRSKSLSEGIPRVAIAGYTNVGKSSLLNRLITQHSGKPAVHSEPILADDRYFATLDPTTRKVYLPSGFPVLVTDTVGFIHDLPESLAVSFRATLEEIRWADIILIVSDPTLEPRQLQAQLKSIDSTLEQFKLKNKPRLYVFSKKDRVLEMEKDQMEIQYPKFLWVSSQNGEGMMELLKAAESILSAQWPKETLRLRPSDGYLLRELYSRGKVLEFLGSKNGGYQILYQAPRHHLEKIKGRLRQSKHQEKKNTIWPTPSRSRALS